ncbi:hypothetical protein IKF15_02690 [Candidatus Saccharibacteria bacterium]|nr:hypothetical protein [Candidatus Saccharibacteria bacterium]
MNGKSKPYAILVFGAPMSGKTTFAEQFSARFNAPFINLATLQAEHHLSHKIALLIVEQMTKCRQNLIIEGFIDTEKQREKLRSTLISAGYTPILVWVQTDLSAIKQRMRKKYTKLEEAKNALSEAYKHIEAPAINEDAIVISGKHTFHAQCRNVLSGIATLNRKKRR